MAAELSTRCRGRWGFAAGPGEGTGSGPRGRRPLGLAVVGGLAFSQIVTLYITPVVYTYLDAFQRRLQRRRAVQEPGSSGAAAAAR